MLAQNYPLIVIAGLVPAIHRATSATEEFAARWIAGTSPAMTIAE
jgi:hypothetical protein